MDPSKLQLPNFLVIGAPRSGTTSLYEYLNAHPEIYMSPVKEPDMFARDSLDRFHKPEASGVSSLAEREKCRQELEEDFRSYSALFDAARSEPRRGEASAIYLASPTAAQHIRRYIPDAKLIAILRDPSDRLHSHYLHARRIRGEGRGERPGEAREFEAAVRQAGEHGCPSKVTTSAEEWVRSGFYFRHLTRFRAVFPAQQLRVFLFEDLLHDPQGLMAEIFRFLEVDASIRPPTTTAFNATVRPRHAGLFRFFTTRNALMRFARRHSPTRLRAVAMRTRNRLLGSKKPALDPELREKLIGIYRQDIEQLQDLLDRDLSAWLAVSPHALAGTPVSGTRLRRGVAEASELTAHTGRPAVG